jgi:hypothetical protein
VAVNRSVISWRSPPLYFRRGYPEVPSIIGRVKKNMAPPSAFPNVHKNIPEVWRLAEALHRPGNERCLIDLRYRTNALRIAANSPKPMPSNLMKACRLYCVQTGLITVFASLGADPAMFMTLGMLAALCPAGPANFRASL